MILTKERPFIVNKPEYKFETVLFLPSNPERKGEGGLRTKGFFKHSYKKLEDDGIWYICDTEGNPVKQVPDENQKSIQEYLSKLNSSYNVTELPLITVITVVLNGEKYLEQTIQSVINQTYPNVEYIVIDGGSTDGTLDIIRKYENYIDYWVSEPDKGIYDAMNKGIIVSLGQRICFLGSDDIIHSDWFMNLFCQNFLCRNYNFIYGDVCFIFKSGKRFIIKYPPIRNIELKSGMKLTHSGSLANRELFIKGGLFNAKYKIAGDYEFLYRNIKLLKVHKGNYIQVFMRIGGTSNNSKTAMKHYKELMYIWLNDRNFPFMEMLYQTLKLFLSHIGLFDLFQFLHYRIKEKWCTFKSNKVNVK